MQALTELNPDILHQILLSLCCLLVALGVLKIAIYLLMTLSPGIWEKLIEKENNFYIRIGLFGKKGSETYKKIERGFWAKAFFGCGGLAVVLAALLIIAFVHWMQKFTSSLSF